MNRLLPVILLLAISAGCKSQPIPGRGEFATNSNGLMYSDNDMKALRFVVDSLNLRFKTCDLNKTFYSEPQTKTFFISFLSETNDLKEIINDMMTGPSPQQLLNKYKSYIKSSDSSRAIILSGKDIFLSGTPVNGYNQVNIADGKNFNTSVVKNKWSYTYSPKGKYWNYYSLNCFYYPEDFISSPIPAEYARLIQYVDCMIDTSAFIYLTDKSNWGNPVREPDLYSNVNDYINKAMKWKKKKNDWEYGYISEEKVKYATENLKNDSVFIDMIKRAADVSMITNQSNDGLEDLIGIFVSKKIALTLKRSRRVVGMCSQDQSPRIHARNIAMLAAEAHSWDIFLRAHLDIMNDRFDRVSDGSYAWNGRKTYLKELEELDLDIVDLMLGLTLRARNVADNHYYGTIWRMGWALTESKEKDAFENKAFAMMKDDRLDEFNRGLIFLLYKTYINYLDEKERLQKTSSLKENVSTFPYFIQASIKEMNEPQAPKRK